MGKFAKITTNSKVKNVSLGIEVRKQNPNLEPQVQALRCRNLEPEPLPKVRT